MTKRFENLKDLLPRAYAQAPCGIAYDPGKGWLIYNLTSGAPEGTQPDFAVLSRTHAIPLHEIALEAMMKAAWTDAMIAAVTKRINQEQGIAL